jgi:hypothetical protein
VNWHQPEARRPPQHHQRHPLGQTIANLVLIASAVFLGALLAVLANDALIVWWINRAVSDIS